MVARTRIPLKDKLSTAFTNIDEANEKKTNIELKRVLPAVQKADESVLLDTLSELTDPRAKKIVTDVIAAREAARRKALKTSGVDLSMLDALTEDATDTDTTETTTPASPTTDTEVADVAEVKIAKAPIEDESIENTEQVESVEQAEAGVVSIDDSRPAFADETIAPLEDESETDETNTDNDQESFFPRNF